MTDNMFDPDRQAAYKAEVDEYTRVTHALYKRPRCGIPDSTDTGTCRMLLGHMGMHVGPVNGSHQSWHDIDTQEVRR